MKSILRQLLIIISLFFLSVAYGQDTVAYNRIEESMNLNVSSVELTDFNISIIQNEVFVQFSTLSEHNSNYFTVEKSKDAKNWNVVNTLNAAGNSTNQIDYSLLDTRPYRGRSHYRLKQTDLDGNFKLYEPVTVKILNEPINKIVEH